MSSAFIGTKRKSIILAAALMVSVLFISTVILVDVGGTGELHYSKYVTYSGGYQGDGTNSASSITVGYDGIVSTEYNPELWAGTFKGVDENDLPVEPVNWYGPNYTVSNIAVVLKITAASSGDYSITIKDSANPHYAVYSVTASSTDLSNVTSSKTDSTTTVSYTAPDASQHTLNLNISVTVHKVFAGWSYSGDTILPGDVINVAGNTRGTAVSATATWITPAVYYQKNSITKTSGSFELSGDELPRPYLMLGKVADGTNKDQVISPDKDTYTDSNHSLTNPESSTYSNMFGHIYTLNGGLYYFGIGGGKLPSGTYRSYDASNLAKLNSAVNSDKGSATFELTGGTIFDQINIDIDKSWGSKHGSNNNNSLFAKGHILIMGAGITNSRFADAESDPVDYTGGVGSLQIFGGGQGLALIDPVSELPAIDGDSNNKKIVYADGTQTNAKVATCIIIHSGVYYNIYAGPANGDVGTKSNNLSTFLVLKGGIVSDTASGGTFGNKSIFGSNNDKNTKDTYDWDSTKQSLGGTYVYVTGAFLPGDNWTDSESFDGISNSYYDLRKGFKNYEASVLLGGGNKTAVYGSTHVFVTDKASVYDVQAAGREGYDKQGASYTGFAYLEISGKAIVRHVACGTLTNAVGDSDKDLVGSLKIVISGGSVASVYGAGYDTYDSPVCKSMLKGTISIDMTGGTVSNIFGGGYRGSIGTPGDSDSLNINIHITGGTVLENVYGGGSGGVEKIKHLPDGKVNSKLSLGSITNSTGQSHVYGNVSILMEGGTVNGNVYGGGMSVPALYSYKDRINKFNGGGDYSVNKVAMVTGDVSVTIDGGTIKGSVYGGGKGVTMSTIQEPGYITLLNSGGLTLYTEDLTKVPILDGNGEPKLIPWYLTGTSADDTDPAYKTTNFVIVTSGTVSGGYYTDFSLVNGNTKVVVSGNSYVMGSVYGGGSNGKVFNDTYDDGNGNTIVEIKGGVINNDVYGGGFGTKGISSVYGDRSVYIDIVPNSMPIENENGTPVNTSYQIKGSVYGGSSFGDDGRSAYMTDPSQYVVSTIVVEQGTIGHDIFGGGLLGRTYGNTVIDVGYKYESNYATSYDRSSGKLIIVGSIYAGANIDTSNPPSPENLFVESLVKGYGNIVVFGNNDSEKIAISGLITGSGNSVRTEKDTTVTLDSFQNKTDMKGLHRITYLVLNQTSLNLTGESSKTSVAGEGVKTLSVFDIKDFTMKWSSSIRIVAPIDYIGEFHSLNNTGAPTTVSSPSNKIIFAQGYTFYVRTMEGDTLQYNTVEGYTLLNSLSRDGNGAFAMCSQNSHGGFSAN